MSKIALEPNASGTGTFTLASPNSNTNRTFTLPDADGEISLGGTPAGTLIYFAASTPPSGYVKANGAALSRTTYAGLFTAIGTTFGSGDGSTTFNVPDLRGEFIRAWDDARGVDSGRSFGSAQADELKTHNHLEGLRSYEANTGAYGQVSTSAGPVSNWAGGVYNRFQFYTSDTGGTETRPRNIALLACIKY